MALSKGSFAAQLEEINSILSKCGFVKDYLKRNNESQYSRNIYRITDYRSLYTEVIDRRDYTFQLKDYSLLQFSLSDIAGSFLLGYSFIPFPLEVQTYEDFLLSNDIDPEEDRGAFRDYYEQSFVEAPTRNDLLMIRYDYSIKEYSETIHSVSHIHFGFGNIRVTSEKVIDPITFMFFVMKQVYYDEWKGFIGKKFFFDKFKKCKENCDDISASMFSESDRKELYLS